MRTGQDADRTTSLFPCSHPHLVGLKRKRRTDHHQFDTIVEDVWPWVVKAYEDSIDSNGVGHDKNAAKEIFEQACLSMGECNPRKGRSSSLSAFVGLENRVYTSLMVRNYTPPPVFQRSSKINRRMKKRNRNKPTQSTPEQKTSSNGPAGQANVGYSNGPAGRRANVGNGPTLSELRARTKILPNLQGKIEALRHEMDPALFDLLLLLVGDDASPGSSEHDGPSVRSPGTTITKMLKDDPQLLAEREVFIKTLQASREGPGRDRLLQFLETPSTGGRVFHGTPSPVLYEQVRRQGGGPIRLWPASLVGEDMQDRTPTSWFFLPRPSTLTPRRLWGTENVRTHLFFFFAAAKHITDLSPLPSLSSPSGTPWPRSKSHGCVLSLCHGS